MQNQEKKNRIEETTKENRPHRWRRKSVFRKWDTALNPGTNIKIDYSYSIWDSDEDISALVDLDEETLYELLNKNIELEKQVLLKAEEALKEWKEIAPATWLLTETLRYKSYDEVEHTNNEWVHNKQMYSEEYKRSNKTYKMECTFGETTKRKRGSWSDIPAWNVSWDLCICGPNGSSTIASQNKLYEDKEKAIKYLKGRVKAYDYLFQEICPAVPPEYKRSFSYCDVLFPGYRLEESEN